MKKTIKYKVLASVGKHPKGVDRKTLQQIIYKAQGRKWTEYKQGYYGTAIQSWEIDGLFKQRERGGKFILSKMGKTYLTDSKLANTLIRANRYQDMYMYYRLANTKMLTELMEAKRKLKRVYEALNIQQYY